MDLVYFKRHETYNKHAPGPAVSCVDSCNSYKKLHDRLHILCKKGKFDKATCSGQSDLELPAPQVLMEVDPSISMLNIVL